MQNPNEYSEDQANAGLDSFGEAIDALWTNGVSEEDIRKTFDHNLTQVQQGATVGRPTDLEMDKNKKD